jgi:UDP-N-acetylglucosamine--N-acetylmuramyl-(pentapeptide) pyrophosphoryl-undecaprenol N-acetylglucosamine transferase
MSKSPPKKVVFAAGGTGGHLFPAQALAQQLLKTQDIELLFAAAKLSDNAYFDKTKFAFKDIQSTTPFRGSLLKAFTSIRTILKGIRESMQLLDQQKPDIVVGFGSFHSFPVLCAAVLKRIPIVLFESNAIPGKVVRLFSKQALFTGIFFAEAKKHLKGETIEVEIPKKELHAQSTISKSEARCALQLEPDRLTLLVFGGSQGAKKINSHILELVPLLHQQNLPFQLIHCTGNKETAETVTQLCKSLNIPCHAKEFEPRMDIAWSAADIAICRAGAMTLSELLHYEVPGILVPYPFAADQHQLKNALFVEKEVGGAVHLSEENLTGGLLNETVLLLSSSDAQNLKKMAIKNFKAQQKKADLGSLILGILK